ncbi:hypothetical protein EJ06DRAFT_580024 [Trichodelitschia bisporula]|uniref:F-box domain-containing protein n=1 Tax=Trichodelitschia bisporula TaxID=703511 RepID=A0A6G1I3X3_9PEZI|nr:hypothetical protein EJ06DRAFT_580024 [Trichodelitschia bisporula]
MSNSVMTEMAESDEVWLYPATMPLTSEKERPTFFHSEFDRTVLDCYRDKDMLVAEGFRPQPVIEPVPDSDELWYSIHRPDENDLVLSALLDEYRRVAETDFAIWNLSLRASPVTTLQPKFHVGSISDIKFYFIALERMMFPVYAVPVQVVIDADDCANVLVRFQGSWRPLAEFLNHIKENPPYMARDRKKDWSGKRVSEWHKFIMPRKGPFKLFQLPPEIRNIIYSMVLFDGPAAAFPYAWEWYRSSRHLLHFSRLRQRKVSVPKNTHLEILSVSRRINAEATNCLYNVAGTRFYFRKLEFLHNFMYLPSNVLNSVRFMVLSLSLTDFARLFHAAIIGANGAPTHWHTVLRDIPRLLNVTLMLRFPPLGVDGERCTGLNPDGTTFWGCHTKRTDWLLEYLIPWLQNLPDERLDIGGMVKPAQITRFFTLRKRYHQYQSLFRTYFSELLTPLREYHSVSLKHPQPRWITRGDDGRRLDFEFCIREIPPFQHPGGRPMDCTCKHACDVNPFHQKIWHDNDYDGSPPSEDYDEYENPAWGPNTHTGIDWAGTDLQPYLGEEYRQDLYQRVCEAKRGTFEIPEDHWIEKRIKTLLMRCARMTTTPYIQQKCPEVVQYANLILESGLDGIGSAMQAIATAKRANAEATGAVAKVAAAVYGDEEW